MSAGEFFKIFSGIGDSYTKGLDEYDKKQTLADLGRSLAENDYNRSAQLAIKAGSLDAGLNLLKLGQATSQQSALRNLLSDPATGGIGGGQGLASLGQPYPSAQDAPAQQAISRVSPAGGNQPRGIRNHNPGNIEDGNFARSIPGYAGSDGRFARFENPEGGFQAQSKLLDTYASKYGLNTIAGIVGRWAPASDGNNVSTYASSVARQMGVDPNQPLDISNPQVKASLIGAMIQHENGRNPYSQSQIATAIGGRAVQPRLPAGPTGGATAYTSTGQPVQTDAEGNAIQPMAVAAQAQPPQVQPAPDTNPQLPPTPYGALNAPQSSMPDWKGMPAPAFAAQQQQAPAPVPMPQQAMPQPMQQARPQPQQVAQMQQPAAYQPNAQEAAQRQQLIQYRAKLISAMPGLDEGSRAAVRARIDDVNARIGDLDKEKWQDVRPEEYRNIPGLDPNYRGVVQRGRNGEIRFPGKPATEVNMKTENAFDQELGKGAAKLMLDIQQDGRNATKAVNVLRVMEKLTENPNFYSGTGGQAMTSFKKAAVAIGLAKSEEAASNELFNSLSNRVTLDGLGGSLGTAVSNSDRDFIQGIQGNINNTPEGNRAVIRMNILFEKRKQDAAKFAADYAKRNGGRLDYGFDAALAEWSEANPMMTDADRKVIMGGASSTPRGNAPAGQQSGQAPGRAPVRINSPADATNLPKGTRIVIPKFDAAGKVVGEEVGIVP